MPYRVERGTSTRASADPGSPDYERWIDWEPGAAVKAFPAHVDTAELLAIGAITEAEAPAPRRKAKAAE